MEEAASILAEHGVAASFGFPGSIDVVCADSRRAHFVLAESGYRAYYADGSAIDFHLSPDVSAEELAAAIRWHGAGK
jgi:hypothetical protein